MKEIAQLIRRSMMDEPDAPTPGRSLRLNPKKLAKSAYKKTDLDDEDFLSADSSEESDQYEEATGLEDDGYTDIEGTGDARKKMLLKAMARARTK